MQAAEPRCYQRNCKHFTGLIEVEMSTDPRFRHVPACRAFPRGIPREIAYGDNDHTQPFEGDGGIRYEREGLED